MVSSIIDDQPKPQRPRLNQIMDKPKIITDPNIMMGKPAISGTRLTVELVLERLAAGETVETLLSSHPRLTREGISAALEYAAQVLRSDIIYPIRDSAA